LRSSITSNSTFNVLRHALPVLRTQIKFVLPVILWAKRIFFKACATRGAHLAITSRMNSASSVKSHVWDVLHGEIAQLALIRLFTSMNYVWQKQASLIFALP
jgi:hypothetical protein